MQKTGGSVTRPSLNHAAPIAAVASIIPALPAALALLPEMAWVAAADGHGVAFNDRWQAVTGIDSATFTAQAHPDDREAVEARWQASLADGSPFEASFRLRRADGRYLWVLARAVLVPGSVPVWTGIATDIDALKSSEDHATLVAGELAHRIGNIFGVVSSVLALSARERPEAAAFVHSARARIAALATAHGHILAPDAGGGAPKHRLQALIRLLLLPYQAVGGPLVEISGDDMEISGQAVTSVALVVHELATNAVKHGALSCPQGCSAVRVRKAAGHVAIVWSETGGPAISESPTRQGFGTALIDRVMKMSDDARARRWWRPEGLAVVMRLRLR